MSLPRKTVKPAHPGADIPDPAHGNMPLPQDGAEVTWDAYWIGREQRGEVVLVEITSGAADVPAPADTEAGEASEQSSA